MTKDIENGYITAIDQAYAEGDTMRIASLQSWAKENDATRAVVFAELLLKARRYGTPDNVKAALLREAAEMR